MAPPAGALALLAVVLAGCAMTEPEDTHLPVVVRRHATVQPYFFAEVNLNMVGNQTIHWSWESGAALEFNIHTHHRNATGVDEVEWLYGSTGTSGADLFAAPRPGGYSLMWNSTSDKAIALDYLVKGAADFESAFPPEPVNP